MRRHHLARQKANTLGEAIPYGRRIGASEGLELPMVRISQLGGDGTSERHEGIFFGWWRKRVGVEPTQDYDVAPQRF